MTTLRHTMRDVLAAVSGCAALTSKAERLSDHLLHGTGAYFYDPRRDAAHVIAALEQGGRPLLALELNLELGGVR